ncbi:nucleotide exchange factor GrpE [Blattabacterium cuenoti]|uniref:nucleotide exchange factor GrpE n=1 Tax=Blattabacterium cuenoti TaxID=1653831 RepID=UPI00163C64AA|nr:nucleotide exchange factor GrpE [Blattabacterium cuenoti]
MNIKQENSEKQNSKNMNKLSNCSCKPQTKQDNHNTINVKYKEEFILLQEQFKKEKDKFLRIFAEFENYKKRIQKERIELFRITNQQMMIDLIPILDDFERSIKELKKYKENILLKGVLLIQEKLINILNQKGLSKIQIKQGDDFNTDFHNAINQTTVLKDNLKGKIIEIVEDGYLLQDKVIRHAKVITGK